MLYPLLFKPNLHRIVWGGHRLRPLKGLEVDDQPIGESWEVSAVPSSVSVVSNGPYAGRDLRSLTVEYGAEMLGKKVFEDYGGEFPLLIKFIDALKDLSIQVHPNDELAQERHSCLGKTEMWYVIDAEPGAYLYAGFKQEITPEEYRQRVADGTITEVLAKHEVQSGDVFFIPAGRVHAICGGILLAEVQQSSDVTYRIFDYNRMGLDGKPRQLHTDEAVDAIDYHVEDEYRTHYDAKLHKSVFVVDCPYFKVKVIDLDKPFHRKLFKYDSFVIYVCLRGSVTLKVRDKELWDELKEVHLKRGESCLVPASMADFEVKPDSGGLIPRLLEVYIDNKRPGMKDKLKAMF